MRLYNLGLRSAAILVVGLALLSCKRTETHLQSPDAARPVNPGDKPAVLATITATGREYADERDNSADLSPVYYVDKVEFSENGAGVAATLLLGKDQWQVTFNGRPGPIYPAVGPVAISPDGRHYAYKAMVGPSWCLVVDGAQTSSCHGDITAVSYSADSNHLLVEYIQQDRYFLRVDNHVTTGSSSLYRTPRFYDGYKRLIFIDSIVKNDAGRLVVSNADLTDMRPIADNINDFWVYGDGRKLAAIELAGSGKSRFLYYDLLKLSIVASGPEFDQVSFPFFAESGDDYFYFGKRGKIFYGVFNGREEMLPGGLEPVWVTINQPDKSVGVLARTGNGVVLFRMFRDSGRQSHAVVEAADWLVYSVDGKQTAFAARMVDSQFVVVNGSKGPDFERVVSPMFSPDGRYLVYRARKGGKRFVVVADSSGKTIRQHPAYDHVHDVRFLKSGNAIAYGVKDGRVLAWKVEPL